VNEDPKKNNDQDGNKPVWLSLVYQTLAVMGFIGATVGGMLHYLNPGGRSPEYRHFVLHVSAGRKACLSPAQSRSKYQRYRNRLMGTLCLQ